MSDTSSEVDRLMREQDMVFGIGFRAWSIATVAAVVFFMARGHYSLAILAPVITMLPTSLLGLVAIAFYKAYDMFTNTKDSERK